MKKPGIILAVTLFVFSGGKVAAQEAVKEIKPDKSPVDISYHRGEDKQPLAKVQYARPSKDGRTIFGELVPFGKVWRTGANEATEIMLYADASFGGKEVSQGRYSLATIPGEDTWTVVLNSALDQWGAYTYDEKKDVARVEVPSQKTSNTIEMLTIYFEGEGTSQSNLVIAWDDTVVKVPVEFNQ